MQQKQFITIRYALRFAIVVNAILHVDEMHLLLVAVAYGNISRLV